MIAHDLAKTIRSAADLDLGRVPEDVLQHAERVIADTVGVIRAGARSPEVRAAVDLDIEEGVASERGNDPDRRDPATWRATILTTPLACTSVANAAFWNATAGTYLELDEGMRPTGHPAMHVLPAAVAVAERRRRPGADLLRAVLAGYEVTSRLFRAIRLRYPVHPHGHLGGIGAAVAAAMLDDVDVVDAAMVAATTPVLSVWDACFDGATTRNTFTGLAAQTGVRSCRLARAGMTGSREALPVVFGEIAGELVDPTALRVPLEYDDLGICRNYLKQHSACALSHAAIDAVLELPLPAGGQVLRVAVQTVQNNMKLDRQPQPNDLSGRFSLPYAVATAVALRRSDPEAFEFRPDVADLARRVRIEVADDLQSQWPDASPARVTVETSEGTFSGTVANPRGHHSLPLTPTEIRTKFEQLVGGPEASTWWPRLTSLREVDDCATLFTEPVTEPVVEPAMESGR
jgi:2-methylcitrate dehydratase PrpD